MSNELKQEMWKNTVNFLKEVGCESVADVCWNYDNDGAITKIEIIFEVPMYLTGPPKPRREKSENE